MKKVVLTSVFLSLALSACAPEFNPPPGYVGGFLWDSDKSRTITVQAGDTLYTISRRYDASTKAIAARNGLRPPYVLTVGQTLILDPSRRHVVMSGQTMNDVARIYNVDLALLAANNDIPPPYNVRIGQELWIPDPFTQAAQPTRNERFVDTGDMQPVTPPPARSSITAESLTPPPGAPPPSASVVEAPPVPLIPDPEPQPVAPVLPPAASPQTETQVAVVPPSSLVDPAPRASARFAWPLSGKVVASFGPAGGGLHNDGINIAAPAGTQVRAADNGVVAYAGNELRGFGNLLLIRHADGWTTAYAHNEKLLVSRGDQVLQGQAIATVGRTGNVDSPQLHFEVRKGTQAMNPIDYLAAP